MPVAKAPTAPQVTVWLSAPTTRSPGPHPAGLQGDLEADPSTHGKEFHAVLPGEGLHAGVEPQGGGGGGRRVVVPGQEDPLGDGDAPLPPMAWK